VSRVDAHHHLWDTGVRSYPWMDGPWADPLRRAFTTTDLEAVAAAHDITETVVVQALADIDETCELLAIAADSDLVAGVVGWVDLTDPGVADVLGSLLACPGGEHLVGIRAMVQDEPDPDWLRRPDVGRGLRAVAEADLVYDLLVRAPQLPAAVDVMRAHPGLRVVLDHCAKPEIAAGHIEPWSSLVAELAALDNVACKLSGLVTEADHATWTGDQIRPYGERILELFGPERVLFGSDWPVCLLAASYDQVAGLAESLVGGSAVDDVFGGNARRIYQL
jgi:L-fuconolactonase